MSFRINELIDELKLHEENPEYNKGEGREDYIKRLRRKIRDLSLSEFIWDKDEYIGNIDIYENIKLDEMKDISDKIINIWNSDKYRNDELVYSNVLLKINDNIKINCLFTMKLENSKRIKELEKNESYYRRLYGNTKYSNLSFRNYIETLDIMLEVYYEHNIKFKHVKKYCQNKSISLNDFHDVKNNNKFMTDKFIKKFYSITKPWFNISITKTSITLEKKAIEKIEKEYDHTDMNIIDEDEEYKSMK
jgi:hypothetical protein